MFLLNTSISMISFLVQTVFDSSHEKNQIRKVLTQF
jgi:hypothetical protein